jgi:integrase
MKPLTQFKIDSLKKRAERYEERDGSSHLYLVIYPTGKKSFVCRYRFAGEKRKKTFDVTDLAAARKLTSDWMFKVAQGIDPAVEERKAANAKADTVQAVCEEYLEQMREELSSFESRKSALERLVYKPIGSEPVESITRSRLVRLFDQIKADRGPRASDLVRAYLHAIFVWFEARSDTFRNPITKGTRSYKPKEHQRTRILNDDELRAVWKATESNAPADAYVRFLLLTGCRRNEAGLLPWTEIDGSGTWTLPAARNEKTGEDLARPLSEAALAIVQARPRNGRLVFSRDGRRPLCFSRLKRDLDSKASGVTGWRLHDLRRTARSLMSRAGVPVDYAERCLGHVIPGVRAVYDRHNYQLEMHKAFEALSRQINLILHPPTGNVVQGAFTSSASAQ